MATIIDNTGNESLKDVAGVMWLETKYSSYTSRRSVDGRFYVGETPNRYFRLWVDHKDMGTAFPTAKDAQIHAASLAQAAA